MCECTMQRGCVKYDTARATFSKVLKNEGVKGFYKGFMARCVTQSLATAVSWTTYETVKGYLIKDKLEK